MIDKRVQTFGFWVVTMGRGTHLSYTANDELMITEILFVQNRAYVPV